MRLIVLFSSLMCLLGQFALPQEHIDAPKLSNGDSWHFKVDARLPSGVSSSRAVTDGIYVVQFSNGRLQLYQDTEEGISRSEVGRSLLDLVPAQRPRDKPSQFSEDLKFPLYVGKEWQYAYKPDIGFQRTVSFKVTGQERVTTPAGNFTALRIEKQAQWAKATPKWGTSVENATATYFYSPETKSIVKYTDESRTGSYRNAELVKFGVSNQ
jgi:hypothetical protein